MTRDGQAAGKQFEAQVTLWPSLTLERFWTKVARGRPGDCWLWKAQRDPARGPAVAGYGRFQIDGRSHLAHRVAWAISANVPIPCSDVAVRHTCDNPPCCNPAHLAAGTQADNIADMVTKGRQRALKGSEHYAAKLTPAAVAEIRHTWTPGDRVVGSRPLARRFGISVGTLHKITSGRSWR